MQFSLYRRGITSDIRFVGDYHCGTLPVNRISWETWIRSDVLDSMGFVADGKYSAEFFDGIKQTGASCEHIALWCARYLLDNAPNATSATVRIAGIGPQAGFAEVTLPQTPALKDVESDVCLLRGK